MSDIEAFAKTDVRVLEEMGFGSHLDPHKSMGPDGIHPRVMRELAEELSKPLSIISQQSWLSGEVPDDWKLVNVTSIHKKRQKEDLGNSRPVSLTSVPGKVMDQIILSAITRHLQDGQGIRPSQQGFRRGRSCLTNLISFYEQVKFCVQIWRIPVCLFFFHGTSFSLGTDHDGEKVTKDSFDGELGFHLPSDVSGPEKNRVLLPGPVTQTDFSYLGRDKKNPREQIGLAFRLLQGKEL
ncbi:hypothetical protein BTVI_41005 [Pitangus sulphuratus]|nr:hypothetical protein BTVI_41005 [Pitangus sulphuratus]